MMAAFAYIARTSRQAARGAASLKTAAEAYNQRLERAIQETEDQMGR